MAGTNRNDKNIAAGPVIILVEPQLPENIGMVARAMANFGLKDLRLVAPREKFPHEKAVSTARKADHILQGTKVFATVQEAVSDLSFLYATTARQRDSFKPVKSPVDAMERLWKKENNGLKTGVLFGRERWGLTNEEISLTNEIITFPVNPAFASLNIAQAVLLIAYEWRRASLAQEEQNFPITPSFQEAPKESLYSFFEQVEKALSCRGYFRPLERKETMVHNLRSVFMRAGLSEDEIRLLRGVISSLEHFSAQTPKGSGAPPTKIRKSIKTQESEVRNDKKV